MNKKFARIHINYPMPIRAGVLRRFVHAGFFGMLPDHESFLV